jgi:hypothetical protein
VKQSGGVEKGIGSIHLAGLRRCVAGRHHCLGRLFVPQARLLNNLGGLVHRILRLHYRRFGAEHLSRRVIHGLTRLPVRTKNACGSSCSKPTCLPFPVGQLHPLVSVVRNHLAINSITQRHQPITEIVESILVNIGKGSTDDRLLSVSTLLWVAFTFTVARNGRHDASPFGWSWRRSPDYEAPSYESREPRDRCRACQSDLSTSNVAASPQYDARCVLTSQVDVLVVRLICR